MKVGAICGLLIMCASSGYGYYDDSHYNLTYVIARMVGYSPEQAYRLASASVSIDYSKETEPVQQYGVVTGSSPIPITMDQPPRWRFHAFRERDYLGDGPEAVAADRAILQQRIKLYEMAFDEKNPGPYLHFYQDEVPHHGYTANGGHWFRQTAISTPITTALDFAGTGLPLGGTTDWLSYRFEKSQKDSKPDATLELVRNTARTLGDYMARMTNGRLKPRPFPDPASAEYRILVGLLKELRERNPYPQQLSQACGWCVIYAKLNPGVTSCPRGCPSDPRSPDFQKHLNGPDMMKANAAADTALGALGMPDRIRPHQAYEFDKEGKVTSARDSYVVFARLNVTIDAALLPPAGTPNTQVLLKRVPTQKGEAAVIFERIAFDRKARRVSFGNVPVGKIVVELHSNGALLTRTEVDVRTSITEVFLHPTGPALSTD
jgi:hypothetical protein